MSSRGEIKKSPLSSRGGLIKVRDNKRQEGSPGTREGRTAGSRTRGLKYRRAGTMEFYRGTSGLFFSLPLPPTFLCLSFRGNSAYRARKQIKLRVKRKIEILRFSRGTLNYSWKRRKSFVTVSSHTRLLILQSIISATKICHRLLEMYYRISPFFVK